MYCKEQIAIGNSAILAAPQQKHTNQKMNENEISLKKMFKSKYRLLKHKTNVLEIQQWRIELPK